MPATTLDLPITLRRLTPEVVNWLLICSAQTGKSADEVAKEIISKAAKRAMAADHSDRPNHFDPDRKEVA